MARDEWINDKYYVDSDGKWVPGKIKSGWETDSTGKKYKNSDGSYIKNTWKQIDGFWYWFDSSGYAAIGWKMIDSNWYYFESDGKMAASKWIGDYYVKSGGEMARDEWINDKYYVDSTGKWVKDKVKDTFTIDNVTYSIISGTDNVLISKYSGNDSSVVIPTNPKYGSHTYTVTEIGEEAFMGKTSLSSIDLPNTITAIRARAFKNCSNLANMTTHD